MIKDILKIIPFCKIMLYGAVFFAGFFTFYSCSALEILPGLCYTDKEGTYLCPPAQSITRSANELRADFSNTIY